MDGILYTGAACCRSLDGSGRAEGCSGILEFADRGFGGCSLSAAAFAAHAKGADFERKAGKHSACGGYGVPILWSAIVSAGFAMLVPGLRSCEELGAKATGLPGRSRDAHNAKDPPLQKRRPDLVGPSGGLGKVRMVTLWRRW